MEAVPIPASATWPVRTGAVVALKPLRTAKSRLKGVPAPYRQHIAWCLAHDTISALADAVDQVVVVSNEPSLPVRLRSLAPSVSVSSEGPPLGMNAALAAGAAELVQARATMVVACVGDLPCLRPETVRRLVAAAAHHPRSYVADASGLGTTMLFARGVSLDPRFQGPSAAAHGGSGAHALTDAEVGPVPDARRDVDTVADLVLAETVGLGRLTSALFDGRTRRLGRFQPITVAEPHRDGTATVRAADGGLYMMASGSMADPAISMTQGQRLNAALADARVLAAWP